MPKRRSPHRPDALRGSAAAGARARRAAAARREHVLGGFLAASAEAIGASLLAQQVSLDPHDDAAARIRTALQEDVSAILSLLESHIPTAGVATVIASQSPPATPEQEPLVVSVDLLRDEGGVATVSAAELDVLGQAVTLACCNGGYFLLQGFPSSLQPLTADPDAPPAEVTLHAWALRGGVTRLGTAPRRCPLPEARELALAHDLTPPPRTRWV